MLVSLRNNNWKWGNIFIGPDLTNIDAKLIAEWTLLSAKDINNNWQIDYKDETIDEATMDFGDVMTYLKNQLYVYGWIYSRNTLWWSIYNDSRVFKYKIPNPSYVIIPYAYSWIDTLTKYKENYLIDDKDLITAQKIAKRFDLNYLRYYSVKLSWDNYYPTMSWSKLAWWKVWDGNSYNWVNYLRDPNDLFHAVIIRYDPIYSKFYLIKN